MGWFTFISLLGSFLILSKVRILHSSDKADIPRLKTGPTLKRDPNIQTNYKIHTKVTRNGLYHISKMLHLIHKANTLMAAYL